MADRKKPAPQQTTGPEAAVIKKYNEFLDPKGLIKMPDLKGLGPLAALDKLILSEGFYVQQGLRTMSEQYDVRLGTLAKLPKGKEVLNSLEVPQLMQNITPLFEFHTQMYDALIRLRLGGGADLLEGLGRCISLFIPFFKLYTDYTKNYRKAAEFLKELTTKNALFVDFLKINETCNGGLRLSTLLKFPISRLPQYLFFFGTVLGRMPNPDSAGARELRVAATAIQDVTDRIAKSQQDEIARKQVVEIQEIVFPGRVMLVDPSRYVVKKGSLKRVFEGKGKKSAKEPKVYLFVLFNDCFLYGSPRKSKLPKAVMRLEGMVIQSIPDSKENKNAFSVSSRIPENHHGNWILCAAKPEGKQTWMSTLQQAIDDYEGQMAHRQLGPEMWSCKDWEEQIFRKKIKSPKMVRRPAPRKATETKGGLPITSPGKGGQVPSTPSNRGQTAGGVSSPPPPPEEEPVEYYISMWDYQAQIPQALSFSAGTIVIVVKKFDNGWWHAKLAHDSPVGLIPYNYLQPYKGGLRNSAQHSTQQQQQQQPKQQQQQPKQQQQQQPKQQPKQQQQQQTSTSGGDQCEECQERPPAFNCPECGTSMCADCDSKIHKKGQRATHKRTAIGAQQTTSTPTPVETTQPETTSVPGPPSTEPCMACSVNPRAFRCDTCNYEMCGDCDYMVHEQPAYAGHYRNPIILEGQGETPSQPSPTSTSVSRNYQDSQVSSPPGPPRDSYSKSYTPSHDYSHSASYQHEQVEGMPSDSKAQGTGSIFPPDNYCVQVSAWDPWIKKAFFFYQNRHSGEKTEHRPSDFQTPPPSPHNSFTPAPPTFGGPVPPMGLAPPGLPPPMTSDPAFDDTVEAPSFGAPPMAPPMDESVVAPPMAPPMEDAPDAPDFSAPPLTPGGGGGGGGGGGDDMLAAIRKGGMLKKAPPTPIVPKVLDSRDQLLEDIRKGGLKGLLKAPTPTTQPAKADTFTDGGGGLAKALEKSLANYRKFVEDDGGNDEEEDGEFADAEWGD